MILSDALT